MIRLLFGLAAVLWFFASSPRTAAQPVSAEGGHSPPVATL